MLVTVLQPAVKVRISSEDSQPTHGVVPARGPACSVHGLFQPRVPPSLRWDLPEEGGAWKGEGSLLKS